MNGEPVFVDKDWYRLRVLGGIKKAKIDFSTSGSLFVLIRFEVVGGPMAGKEIPANWFVTPETKDFAIRKLKALEFDPINTNLRDIGDKIAGKEVWGQCSIQPKQGPRGGFWEPRVDMVQSLQTRIKGGPEAAAASIFGNTVTPPGDDDEWNDNY